MSILSRKSALGCGAAIVALAIASGAWAQQRSFNIPAQDATQAIPEFARQAGLQIIAPGGQLRGVRTRAVSGEHDARAALSALIRGTGLVVASDTGGIITLRRDASGPQSDAGDAPQGEAAQVEDIVVTGSRIRGANPTAPVRIISREEIDRTGYSNVGELTRSLPENFGGSQNPGVLSATGTNIGNTSFYNSSTVNLRGLGSDATLVLVNGRRLAGNGSYQAASISGIPFDALGRVEVLTDGASAIYGSDAVAGVVNFILRKDYDGAALKARLGGTTEGGGQEQTYSALAGRSADRWYAMANIEYSRREMITAAQRDLTSSMSPEVRLLQPETRRSAFFSAGADLIDGVRLSMDSYYNHQASGGVTRVRATAPTYYSPVTTELYGFSPLLEANFGENWSFRLLEHNPI